MEIKIVSRKEEPLLSRVKIDSEIAFEKATPSITEIRDALASQLGKDKDLIAIRGVYNEYGLRKAKGIAYLYDNEEIFKRFEAKKEKKKDNKGAKQEEAPKEKK